MKISQKYKTISFVFIFFYGQMESEISEANTHPPAGGFG